MTWYLYPQKPERMRLGDYIMKPIKSLTSFFTEMNDLKTEYDFLRREVKILKEEYQKLNIKYKELKGEKTPAEAGE